LATPGPPQPPGAPPWAWAALVAFALLVITAGAIVGMVSTGDRGSAAPAGSAATGAGAESLPPTVPVGPATDFPDTGLSDTSGIDTGPAGTIPTDTSASVSGLRQWPAGTSGFTVVLASIPEAQGQSAASAKAQEAVTAGLPQVGVLRSSDYSSLRSGYWVVFSGIYTTAEQARQAVSAARAAGWAGAYPRTVTP
jgi:hypothetical protein